MEQGLSSFDIYVIVSELQDLLGGYIEKIYQLTREEILLKIKKRHATEKETIFIRNGELLCRTQHQFTTPTKPPMFSMALRKYLLNGTIQQITQHEFDRIIQFTIATKEGLYMLIFELFKNGNTILVNAEGTIIQPLHVQQWAHRTVKSHEQYKPPPAPINLFVLSCSEFEQLLRGSTKDLVRTLATTLNVSGLYAEELCLRSDIDKHTKPAELTQESIKHLYATLQTFLDIFKKKEFHPVFIKKDEEIINILPVPFLTYQDHISIPVEKFALGLQEFINKKTGQQTPITAYEKNLEKLLRQLQKQHESIKEFTNKKEEKRREGDILYLHYEECQQLLDQISFLLQQKEKQEGIQTINKNQLVKAFDPEENTLIVLLSDNGGQKQEITLDFRKTLIENAEQAYEDSKKYKDKIDGAQEAIMNTQKQIESQKEKKFETTEKKQQGPSEKRFWFEPYRWCLSTEGNVIVGGRDAKTNEHVVKKYLKDGDRYVHADIHGAPSCVVKNQDYQGKPLPISEKTLRETCMFGACYSKAWKQFGEAQAYWVLPEQVSKTPQSGEFVPKGGFIIRGKRNYVQCSLELAVGAIVLDGATKVMGGPIDVVSTRSDRYAVLKSGTMKSSTAARLLSKVFKVSVDEVLRVLPPGDVQIMRTSGFTMKQ